MLCLYFTSYKQKVLVHNINIRMYIYRKKGSSSHLTFQRWRKNKCKVRVMVQMLHGSLHVPPRFERVQALLPRFTSRRGTLENPCVPPQLLLVNIFSGMVRFSACNDQDCMAGLYRQFLKGQKQDRLKSVGVVCEGEQYCHKQCPIVSLHGQDLVRYASIHS